MKIVGDYMVYEVDGNEIDLGEVDVNDDLLVLEDEDLDETQDLTPLLDDTQEIQVVDSD